MLGSIGNKGQMFAFTTLNHALDLILIHTDERHNVTVYSQFSNSKAFLFFFDRVYNLMFLVTSYHVRIQCLCHLCAHAKDNVFQWLPSLWWLWD